MSKSHHKKIPNHLHKYKKMNLSNGLNGKNYFIYHCVKPTCSHYVPIKQSEGKICECYICGQPMIITRKVLNGSGGKPMSFPHCTDCTKHKKQENIEAIAEILKRTEI